MDIGEGGEAIQVGGAAGGTLAVYSAGLGMDQRLLIGEDADAGGEALGEVAACHPIGDDMVGLPGQQHLHVHSAGHRRLERIQQHVVGHEVRVGQQDVVLGAIYRLKV